MRSARRFMPMAIAAAALFLVVMPAAVFGEEPKTEKDREPEPEAGKEKEAAALPHADDVKTWEKACTFIKMFKFETLWYLHYRYGRQAIDSKDLEAGYEQYNTFNIGRGYLTMRVEPVKWFEGRITLDAHQDESGDMKIRLKYLYGKFTVPFESKILTDPYLEFGIVHMPWLDYEEHVNWYRCQGTMLMERNKLFNSADFGATFGMLLGEKLPDKYREEVNGKYPGTWGSLALGVYNGGGYHAVEENSGKSFEARLSVRPLGFVFPNIQLSYFVIIGHGNVEGTDDYNPPKWRSHTAMASFEHKVLVLTGQFVCGEGNQKGDFTTWDRAADPDTGEESVIGIEDVHDYMGASGFLEVKLPWIKSSLIGRYDWFEKEGKATQRIISGYAFHFHELHKNFILLDVDYVIPDSSIEFAENYYEVKLTLQIKL
ncbi:MAG: hypothetical protein ABIJ56_16860 [Pseudomonadota bacterium]